MAIPESRVSRLPVEGDLPSLERASAWLNSAPLPPADLRGKVVLVDFWTYSCINWRRTLPYIRTWADRYRDQGLIVVGVHTPEFSFEEETENVRRAIKDQSISYPIALDSQYAIWNAFDNHYWPALYLADADGQVRHHQFGEGGYEQIQEIIEELLAEAGKRGPSRNYPTIIGAGAESAPNWKAMRSPETYLGHGRSEGFSSPELELLNHSKHYSTPHSLRLNHWALAGRWEIGTEAAVSRSAGGRIAYRFHARDVHLVMGKAGVSAPIRFRVSIDGEPPGAAHGIDVDDVGLGSIDEPRMYQLIRQQGPIMDRELEVEFEEPGAALYVLTFG